MSLTFLPSNENGIPFSTLSVLTVHSQVVLLEGPFFREVTNLLSYLESRPVLSHELSEISDKWRPFLRSVFPFLSEYEEERVAELSKSERLQEARVFLEKHGATLMVPHPESRKWNSPST